MTGGGRVVVTGIGMVTPAGTCREATWERVLDGKSTAGADGRLAGLPVDFACAVEGFDPAGRRPWRLDRHVQFAVAAATEAVTDARLDPGTWDGGRVGVVIGSAAGGVGTFETQTGALLAGGPRQVSPLALPKFLPNMAAGQVGITLGARGPNLATATACASGATALGIGLGLLRGGLCDVVLAGGADAMVTRLCAAGFARMGALSRRREDPGTASRPFDADRDGFVLAEGAGVLVLERAAAAERRGAGVYAELAGFGASADACHQVAPDMTGAGARRALTAALADAGAGPDEVSYVNAHGTSTPLNDGVEAAVIERELGREVAVSSTKGVTGHMMGAAGAVEAALTALTVSRGRIPGTAGVQKVDPGVRVRVLTEQVQGPARVAVSHSFGFGGQNAVLVLRQV